MGVVAACGHDDGAVLRCAGHAVADDVTVGVVPTETAGDDARRRVLGLSGGMHRGPGVEEHMMRTTYAGPERAGGSGAGEVGAGVLVDRVEVRRGASDLPTGEQCRHVVAPRPNSHATTGHRLVRSRYRLRRPRCSNSATPTPAVAVPRANQRPIALIRAGVEADTSHAATVGATPVSGTASDGPSTNAAAPYLRQGTSTACPVSVEYACGYGPPSSRESPRVLHRQPVRAFRVWQIEAAR